MYTERPVAKPEPLDLAKLARHAVELTLTRNQLPSGSIVYSGAKTLLVRGEAEALETVVLNLLDNAVKYSKEQVQVQVELALTAKGRARLSVTDQGVGMSRAHLRFIFKRFYRIGREVRRSHTGTGLGLFIVKSVVSRHRGTVSADSVGPDCGTTFTVTLPGVISKPLDEPVGEYGYGS
jgi:signal transduction histidine kinase